MYSVSHSWVGQTFALASENDSRGRKSRIRRSKEERKAMVESFVKRHQSLNGGSFPSLNLTHKEVGGSFYTVREIFREIIQENRVLGPAQFNYEVKEDDTVAGHYPLESISSEPQGLFLETLNELNVDHREKETVELNLDNNEQYSNHGDLDAVQCSSENQTDYRGEDPDKLACKSLSENLVISSHQEHAGSGVSFNSSGECHDESKMGNGQFVNCIQTNGISQESDNLLAEASPVCETCGADGELELMGASQAELTLPTDAIDVETFPLKPAVNETDDLDCTSTDSGNLTETLSNFKAKNIELSNSSLVPDKISSFDSSSDLVTTAGADNSKLLISGGGPDMVIQHADLNSVLIQHRGVNLTDELDMSNSSPIKEDTPIVHDGDQIASHSDLTSKTAEQNHLQPKNAPNGATCSENTNGTSSKLANKEPISMVANGNDIQRDNKAVTGNSPPLDRINLESWKRVASKQGNNPLLSFFKAFLDAFVKFWSE